MPHKDILDLSHYNKLFSQTLSLIPKHGFQKLENRHKSGKRYEFLTNHFRLFPKTITDIYKERWQIEMMSMNHTA